MFFNRLFILLVLFASCSNPVDENDLIESGIKGQVKQVSLNIYTPTKDVKPGRLLERYVYSYSIDGRVMQQLKYDNDGKLQVKIVYIRNSETQNVSELKIYDGAGKMIQRYSYTYDASSKESGNTVFDSIGKMESRIVYEYDDTDVRLGGIRYNQKGEIVSIEKEKYDAQNRLIAEVHWASNRQPTFQSIITRDSEGAVIKQRLQIAGQKARVREFKSLLFDKLGSWTERSVHENGKLVEYMVRKLVYY